VIDSTDPYIFYIPQLDMNFYYTEDPPIVYDENKNEICRPLDRTSAINCIIRNLVENDYDEFEEVDEGYVIYTGDDNVTYYIYDN
jgi:hypothetical protein